LFQLPELAAFETGGAANDRNSSTSLSVSEFHVSQQDTFSFSLFQAGDSTVPTHSLSSPLKKYLQPVILLLFCRL
jgi:hypothetical protein